MQARRSTDTHTEKDTDTPGFGERITEATQFTEGQPNTERHQAEENQEDEQTRDDEIGEK